MLSVQSDTTCIFFRRYMLHVSDDDRLLNQKHVACTYERKYMLWLTENLDFIPHMFILLPDMQFSNTENALLRFHDKNLHANAPQFNCLCLLQSLYYFGYCTSSRFFLNKISGSGSLPPPHLEFLICWGPL
jgi:hypothetical protein